MLDELEIGDKVTINTTDDKEYTGEIILRGVVYDNSSKSAPTNVIHLKEREYKTFEIAIHEIKSYNILNKHND